MTNKETTNPVEARVRTSNKVGLFGFPVGLLAAAAMSAGLLSAAHADEPVAYEIVDDEAIPASLTGAPGDPEKGLGIFLNRQLGNCLGCHAVSELAAEPFHGEIGPPLDGVGDIYSERELRLRVVNAKIANPDTIMPGFYVTEGLNRVMPDFAGKTILSAEQVEDIVAYLMTLKDS